MKNTKKSVKSIKRAMIISAAAMAVCIIGIILVFVKEKRWDAIGCSMLACNTAIFCCNSEAYSKAKKESEE